MAGNKRSTAAADVISHSALVKQWQTENTEPIRFLNFSFHLFFWLRRAQTQYSFNPWRPPTHIISSFSKDNFRFYTHVHIIHFTAMATPSSQPCDTLQYARTHIPEYVEEKEAEAEAD